MTGPPYVRLAVALPALLFVWFCTMIPAVSAGEILVWELAWLPQLGIDLDFVVDGLSLLFALLITGIGAFVFLFAGVYMRGYPQRGRFTLFLVSFMLAMLGLVLADNLIALFVFWELTTITSFLLIGYSHENATARRAALQGLLVTGAGALAMLAGFVVLGQAAGTFSLREMLASDPATFADHPRYTAIVVLVLLGAFTKSAQFPFHFWLPNAMAAPTPVSAYLHSATMVKAGVFLLTRLTPLLGGTQLWMETLTVVGAVTAVYAAFVSLGRSDLKQVLAYTTVMALGTCVLFLGSSPVPGPGEVSRGVLAALAFLVAHALYKAALFLVAGTIEKATGTRDLARLGGLWRAMPVTFAAAVAASVSMAGVPYSVGFLGKELLYTVGFAPDTPAWLPWAAFLAAAPVATIAIVLACQPFLGPRPEYPKPGREGHWALWCGPVVLGALGIYWGLAPEFPFLRLLVPAETAVLGQALVSDPGHAPWHSTGEALALTLATLGVAGLGFRMRGAVAEALAGLRRWIPLSGDRAYDAAMDGIAGAAVWQTRRLQSGVQRHYLLIVFATLGLSLAVTLWIKDVFPGPVRWTEAALLEWSLAALVAAASIVIIRSRSRLLCICALGVVGVSTALIFLLFGAPDVAMTQLTVETLVTVIVAIVLLKLPNFSNEVWPSGPARLGNAFVAVTVGIGVTLLMLAVTASPPQPDLQEYFERTAVPGGQGRNIVNVILVDFRALDTMGEITVLAIAGAAVFAMLLPGPRRRKDAPLPGPGGIMDTVILRETTRRLVPLILIFSVFLLLRGHEQPGGGFVGGLVASIALSLYAFVFGPQATRGILRVDPRAVGAVGLAVAIASGFIGSIRGAAPFLTGQWGTLAGLKIGTPVMFDVGVYLVVIGVVMTFVIRIKEQ
ncbi:MAG: proton-conducting transporter membrane subunit [Acidobacteria bacterium]|nr:proton-conducting transporter membrane subunit [Acidobacteriota bacterium]